jgi:catechol 2,3-dioxygenase
MSTNAIHPATNLGPVSLRVRDLSRSVEFYTRDLGFGLLALTAPVARLGAGDDHLLTLHEDDQARHLGRTTGLYHFAVLVPSRLELARSLQQLGASKTPLQGFADHLVSEAIYLADPDGNGIEIYRDRPRDQWPRQDGQLLMATDPLDVNGLLAELAGRQATWNGLAPGTTIGHIHLQVADLKATMSFYQQVLGFELILRYGPSAAFLAAGGYHHHVGLNTWAGIGLPPAPSDAAGLMWFTINLPDQATFQAVSGRLAASAMPGEQTDHGLLIRDPAGIGIMLRVQA